MSTNENGVSKAVTTDVTPSTTPTIHTEAAQARLQELRKMRDLLPRFTVPATAKDRIRLNSAASVPAEFVEMTVVAVANENALVRGDGATPAEVRDLTAYADAYGPFADELEAFAQFVRYSVTAARNQAGSEALTTYALAQRLAKRPKTAHLAPYVADMRRALGRTRKLTPEALAQKAARKAAKTAAQEPAQAKPQSS